MVKVMNMNELHRMKELLPECPPLIGRSNCLKAAVIVPFVQIGGAVHLLFQQRAACIPQGGEVCFPGGEFDGELDGSLQKTALRETVEELGIRAAAVEFLGSLGTVVSLRGITVDCFVAHLNVGFPDDLSIDPDEVARVFTLPVEWFLQHAPEKFPVRVEMHPQAVADDGTTINLFPAQELGLPKKYHTSWLVKDQEIPVYRTPEGTVWGMTAQVVEELVTVLRQR
jgi:coenzyme A diphosphatase NUDT7